MFKTPLIIGAGTGWSATSPLHLTLQCANKCSHTGILKEDHLLSHVYSQDAWGWREPWYKKAVNDSMVPVMPQPGQGRPFSGNWSWRYPSGLEQRALL